MSSYNIGVIYPSRGLLFTETFKELLGEVSKHPHTIYWSHGNKLPACFNKPLSRALRASHSHILILEDDMVIPKGLLDEMLAADEDIISCDYPIVEAPSGTVLYDRDDNAIFTGTGFMLAKKHVFDKMPRPIFKANLAWDFKQKGDKVIFTARETNADKVYGHHDINFGLYQYINAKPIKVHKTILAQRKLVNKGESSNNIGVDDIILYNKYNKINMYMIEEDEKEEEGQLVSVLVDGKPTLVEKEAAIRLGFKPVKQYIEKGNILLDINNNKRAQRALGVKQ